MKKLFKRFLVFLSVAGIVAAALHIRRHKQTEGEKETVEFERHHVNTLRSNTFNCHNIKNCRTRHVVMRDWGLKNKKLLTFGSLAIVLTIALSHSFLGQYSYFLKTSLLGIQEQPFTGTVVPVEKVPRWTDLTEAEYRMTFDQIPKSKLMPTPEYDPAAIKKGYKSSWGENNDERNAYITYSVLHMGDYRLEANHGNGSHVGVDFKLPINTPIRAMANGTVYKVENSDTGFGNAITIIHRNVPVDGNPNQTQTLYSTYAHLTRTDVKVGQQVEKGELIGTSGNSGNATAAHLHFQVTKDDAPFQPYWPFTWKDLQAANTTYFDAINDGLNRENGFLHSVNPMTLIAQYSDYEDANLVVATDPIVDTQAETTNTEEVSKPVETIQKEEPVEVVKETAEEIDEEEETIQEPEKRSVVVTKKGNQKGIVIDTDRMFIPGKAERVAIHIEDENLVVSNGIQLDSTLKHLARIQPSLLQPKHFVDGVAEVIVTTESDSSFKLIASGDFGEVKSDSLRAHIFTDIPRNHKHGDAIKYLKDNQIVQGYGDGTFRPDNTINRAEAVKILLEGNTIDVERNPNPFNDVASQSWYENYVTTAAAKKIVKGYEDGSFKPEKSITRAEFLKVALETAGVHIPTEGDNYDDVHAGTWFENYFRVAKARRMFETSSGNVDPNKPITRGEAAQVMYLIEEIS